MQPTDVNKPGDFDGREIIAHILISEILGWVGKIMVIISLQSYHLYDRL